MEGVLEEGEEGGICRETRDSATKHNERRDCVEVIEALNKVSGMGVFGGSIYPDLLGAPSPKKGTSPCRLLPTQTVLECNLPSSAFTFPGLFPWLPHYRSGQL